MTSTFWQAPVFVQRVQQPLFRQFSVLIQPTQHDFIRVQTGVNAKAGWLGENSTEVFGFTDENINQGK